MGGAGRASADDGRRPAAITVYDTLRRLFMPAAADGLYLITPAAATCTGAPVFGSRRRPCRHDAGSHVPAAAPLP